MITNGGKHMKKILLSLFVITAFAGCKYYGSALPPEYPMSMDNALAIARDKQSGPGGVQREIIRKSVRPDVHRPAYVPESELAVVAPPRTLLVWTYPFVKDDNTRVFGNWATIFLQDRYEWVAPANERAAEDEMVGGSYGTFE